MRYHVQIGRGFRVARALNLTERELNERILTPWRAGATISLGDREWEAARSELRVLAGRSSSRRTSRWARAGRAPSAPRAM